MIVFEFKVKLREQKEKENKARTKTGRMVEGVTYQVGSYIAFEDGVNPTHNLMKRNFICLVYMIAKL